VNKNLPDLLTAVGIAAAYFRAIYFAVAALFPELALNAARTGVDIVSPGLQISGDDSRRRRRATVWPATFAAVRMYHGRGNLLDLATIGVVGDQVSKRYSSTRLASKAIASEMLPRTRFSSSFFGGSARPTGPQTGEALSIRSYSPV
jgi:hypothetical protein